jgi:SpoVK/Ycf46/Vps4 family AAA+-type ATPase
MNWTEEEFGDSLKDQLRLEKFVHNRIIVDGQFMQFCEEKKVSVECIYKDSAISWKTEHNKEKFFVQGVFLIKSKGLEFLHAALFHKGNQNEDEISFFVICSEGNYEAYLKLRNEFDEWVSERDRSNLHIRVIEGEDLPYTKDHTWEDLFLPQEIKDELKALVENFLASKEFYLQNKIPWKRGVLLYGKPGNGKTSIIRTIMSVYNFKPVTIVAGANDEAVREAFTYAEDQSPALLYFEDLDSLLEKSVDPSSFLNLMDGISAKNGLLVMATANEVKKLKANITDRPSRFDRKFEIPLPNAEMAYIYLKRWFGNLITLKKGKELAKYASQHEFSYAYLKELYISAMFEALAHNRKAPTEKDVDSALSRLLKDKNLLNSGAVNMDKYFK